ncbi:MAG: hydrogenase maturation protease [Planctomycetes bacterium]|nr:hydrogenase maturation protease [Planctomycetota bacterium]
MPKKKPVTKHPVLILGIGNTLLKDDGIGIHVTRKLEKLPLHKNVTLMDGGTGGLNLFEAITTHKKIIIIDAIDLKSVPGTIKRISLDEARLILDETHSSMHQNSISEVFKLAESLGKRLDVVIFGIQPKEVAAGLELTHELKAVIPAAIRQILAELR